MNLFQSAIKRTNLDRPPVWFMRQAGRYHSHYQGLKKSHTFIDLCKNPKLACETTMGPIDDFDFDAAILFSDILFPLEVMGMGLTYDPAPALSWKLRSKEDLSRFDTPSSAEALRFQGEAIALIRKALPETKGLLGFVGSPLTLFFYAVEGSHKKDLSTAKSGISNGLYEAFFTILKPLLLNNMVLQAKAGIDSLAVFDTCAGDVSTDQYREIVVPTYSELFREFKEQCPNVPLTYYGKKTDEEYWSAVTDLPIDCLGVDENADLANVLDKWTDRFAIQGNFNQEWMTHPTNEVEPKIEAYFEKLAKLPQEKRTGWICGLGHGILPTTPEENVRLFLKKQKEYFE